MIDWHSHILPRMDDGSRSVAESIAMLEAEASQGVGTVVATPHFYADDESVESFLERRRISLEALKAETPDGLPKVILGAEVRYYPGISRLEGLKSLRIEGTKLLLLEMPMATWTESVVRELVELSAKSSFRIVLAHVERYMSLQNKGVWDRIIENGILMQSNAGFFTAFGTKRRALSLLKRGTVRFVGSDCHNMTGRPPLIGKAFDVISKKLGNEFLSQITEYGYSKLGINNELI